MAYKEAYLREHVDNFRFMDPECHDIRVREINMRSKRCNRCLGFTACSNHPDFWLYGKPERMERNEKMEEIPNLPDETEALDEADEEAPEEVATATEA